MAVRIRTVPRDLRSYKNLPPALRKEPDAWHVTADDDIYYRPDWLRTLVEGFRGETCEVLSGRAHLVTLEADGSLRPCRKWHPNTEVRGPDPRLFPTSGAGVLFPPGSLDPRAVDAERAMEFAPRADDLWWCWMARLAGIDRPTGGGQPPADHLKGASEQSLLHRNKRDLRGKRRADD
ncbi:MAG: hypothetical protein EA351_01060 [Gemmatimonadales bacterium]|nr:MAG: hypothetical protein EA351_01060 [Gemmatimonadales bacterium]